MNALRQNLKELKVAFEKMPFAKSLMIQSKYIFAIGGFVWILSSFIPDTTHFTVTFFSSIGRPAMLIGLLLTMVKGDEARFEMTMSIILSISSFIIIIVELSAAIYLSSFESYLFLLLFCFVAVDSSKYLNNDSSSEEVGKEGFQTVVADIPSYRSEESESLNIIEPLPQKAPPASTEPSAPSTKETVQSEIPLQTTAPGPSKITKPSTKETVQSQILTSPIQKENSNLSSIERMPTIKPVPNIGRAPGVEIKPK